MIPMTLGEIADVVGAVCPVACRAVKVLRVVTDSREARAGDLFFAISGERFDGHDFVGAAFAQGAVAAVVARIVPTAAPPATQERPLIQLVVDSTISSLARLATHYRKERIRPETVVVAVTGSNGKTTTKSMIDHVLRPTLPGKASPKSFNNYLGVPLTLLSVDVDDRYLVVEMGMNAPGEIASLAAIALPHVAVITSIGEAHLEGLGCIDAIAAEKTSLCDFVRPGGLAVVNVDRPEIDAHLRDRNRVRMISFGCNSVARLRVTAVRGSLSGTSFSLDSRYELELPIPGFHHATNAAAAFAVARWFGVDPDEIVTRLRTFVAPEGRTRMLTIGTSRVVDDSYNANPASVLAAVAVMAAERPGYRAFVLGDMLELGEASSDLHDRVVRAILEAGIETLVAVGRRSAAAGMRLANKAGRTRIVYCDGPDEAEEAVAPLVGSGHTIWVKGSRGMQLDRAVRALVNRFGPQAAVA